MDTEAPIALFVMCAWFVGYVAVAAWKRRQYRRRMLRVVRIEAFDVSPEPSRATRLGAGNGFPRLTGPKP